MALGTQPQQLGAAVAAPRADVRVEVEDRVVGEREVALDLRPRIVEAGKRRPDGLVHEQGMRVLTERVEEQRERLVG